MTALLQLEEVHTHIGRYHILHGVSFAVPRGEVTMLLGRNGAGKTTTLRTIMGLWRASSGHIAFDGAAIAAAETPDISRRGIAYVPENMGIFADLTVAENMLVAARGIARLHDLPHDRLAWIYRIFPVIEQFWDYPAGKLSGGQKQMLAVARALLMPQRLVIVDEPSKGLAPSMVDSMIEAFAALKREGATLLLVEQNIDFATRLGDQVAVMDNGRVVHEGSMRAFADDDQLTASLLGLAL
jgi:branched-chain amino acid transport system ATP-binding protein